MFLQQVIVLMISCMIINVFADSMEIKMEICVYQIRNSDDKFVHLLALWDSFKIIKLNLILSLQQKNL